MHAICTLKKVDENIKMLIVLEALLNHYVYQMTWWKKRLN